MNKGVDPVGQGELLRSPLGVSLMLATVLGLLLFAFKAGLLAMVNWWDTMEEYSHGYMIPMVALFLLWQRAPMLANKPVQGQWGGFVLMVFALALWVLGELSALFVVVQYAFLLALIALIWSLMGRHALLIWWAAIAYLIFMIPLPAFLFNALSAKLQLISSMAGAEFLRLVGISVYLEGNVIDLGGYKLQVVEACSGLRYLFPLMSFGFLIAYVFRGPTWQRVVLFLATIPITVFMNSFRIGFIGVTVDRWGIEMAEGFLHDFEGWSVFMGCLGLLLLLAWTFHLMSKEKGSVLARLDLDVPPASVFADVASRINWVRTPPFILSVVLLAAAVPLVDQASKREEVVPERVSLSQFPLVVGEWHGIERAIEKDVLDTLKLTDYISALYSRRSDAVPVNFYVAYYASQRKGASVHSPRSCLPGGGWQMTELAQRELPVSVNGAPLVVNRTIIRQGEEAQLVYYWFQQRGRVITNEYELKWLLFWDSLTKQRTDGSLVRLVTYIEDGKEAEADARMQALVADLMGLLPKYVPN